MTPEQAAVELLAGATAASGEYITIKRAQLIESLGLVPGLAVTADEGTHVDDSTELSE